MFKQVTQSQGYVQFVQQEKNQHYLEETEICKLKKIWTLKKEMITFTIYMLNTAYYWPYLRKIKDIIKSSSWSVIEWKGL